MVHPVSRRYLRAYLFDHRGDLLPSLMRSEKVSSALLPVMKLQGMRTYAGKLTGYDSEPRRRAVLECLIAAQERAVNTYRPIFGVALVACPDRSASLHHRQIRDRSVTLSSVNGYVATFAAVGANNQMWAGDILRETLKQVEERLGDCIRHVRNRSTEDLVEMFDSVGSR